MNWSYWLFGYWVGKARRSARRAKRRRHPYTRSTRARGHRARQLDAAIRPGAVDHGRGNEGSVMAGLILLAIVAALCCCCGWTQGVQWQRDQQLEEGYGR